MRVKQTFPPDGTSVVASAHARASDLAERYIRSLIFSGQLAPGDKLPSERELAAHFGIARITLRAALRSLETVGFLTVRIGSKGGAWINDADTIRQRWEEWMRAHRHEIDEMLEFRRFVETEIARLAALRRTEEDIQALEAAAHDPREDRPSLVQWHFGFHEALAKTARNHYLAEAMVNIRSELFVPRDWTPNHNRVTDIRKVHDRILEAVKDGDPARAVAEMHAHLDVSEEPFREALRNHK